jgi:hypothetical protein
MAEKDIKEMILVALSNSVDTKAVADAGLLSERDNLDYQNRENLESQYTALAEYLTNVSMEPLFKAYKENNLSINEIFWLLHAISTAGWVPDEGADEEKEGRSLEFRTHEVKIGDELAPPHHKDLEGLMNIFTEKIEKMLEGWNNVSEEMMMCAWTYTIFIVIHPYSDGNGRTGRAIIKFLDYISQRKRGFSEAQCQKRTFPNRRDDVALINKAIQTMHEAIEYDHLISRGSTGKKTSVDRYKELASSGRGGAYFQEAKELLEAHFDKINGVADLYKNPYYDELAHLMMQTDYIKPGETKRLVAEQGVKKFQQSLSI